MDVGRTRKEDFKMLEVDTTESAIVENYALKALLKAITLYYEMEGNMIDEITKEQHHED